MSQFLRLSDYRTPPFVHFDRRELAVLLDLYSRHVAAGEWRDYAIDSGPNGAVFAVFRSAHERPLFTIAKLPGERLGYVVHSGPQRLRQAATLAEALRVFGPILHVVT